jgi:hypothetical protein
MNTKVFAKMVKQMTPNVNGLGRTVTYPTTRTFTDEMDAVNQLVAWKDELEAKGWFMVSNFGHDDQIWMRKLDDKGRAYGFAKLFIA